MSKESNLSWLLNIKDITFLDNATIKDLIQKETIRFKYNDVICEVKFIDDMFEFSMLKYNYIEKIIGHDCVFIKSVGNSLNRLMSES